MPLYTIICKDRADAGTIRRDTRERHLAYLHDGDAVRIAGPFTTDGTATGSLIVIEAPDLAAAKAWSAGDPYLAAGLFDSVEVSAWTKVIG